ncbi:MAG: MoaD/ThiS family protein [Halodesulfurarchaeum sp.]
MNQQGATRGEADVETRTVTVRLTGKVRTAVGTHTLSYTFEGTTLRDFLESFLQEYDVADLILATDEETESAHGWAPEPDELPGTWRKNPPGDQVRRFARVLVNGTFNEHLDGFDTELEEGDRVALMYPFVFCV